MLQPLSDILFVEPELEKHALFELISQKKSGMGRVIVAGPKARSVKVGDRIVFGEFVGQEATHEGHEYLVMREEHVLGIVNE